MKGRIGPACTLISRASLAVNKEANFYLYEQTKAAHTNEKEKLANRILVATCRVHETNRRCARATTKDIQNNFQVMGTCVFKLIHFLNAYVCPFFQKICKNRRLSLFKCIHYKCRRQQLNLQCDELMYNTNRVKASSYM